MAKDQWQTYRDAAVQYDRDTYWGMPHAKLLKDAHRDKLAYFGLQLLLPGEITDDWLELMGGTKRPGNGWMFGPLMVWRYGSGWGVVIGSMGPDETWPVTDRGQVLALLYGLNWQLPEGG